MTSFADSSRRRRPAEGALARVAVRAAAIAGLALLGAAAVAHAAETRVPEALAARVAAEIARRWDVDSADVSLAWGRFGAPLPSDPAAPFRLAGAGTDGWFVAVFAPSSSRPAAVRVRAGAVERVMVATRALRAGSRLEAADLRAETRAAWGQPARGGGGTLPAPGWQVRRSVGAGEVLAAPAVAPAPCVLAGQPVRVEWTRGAVHIALEGTALQNAVEGDPVRVRLRDRREPVTGVAAGPSLVRLDVPGGTP